MKYTPENIAQIHRIIKPDNILVSIRDAARASAVTDTQVRYWIKNGYLQTVKAENGAIKLPYNQIAAIRLIKAFLDEGYVLSAAAQKAQEKRQLARSLRHMFIESIHGIEQTSDQTIIDLGPLANDPTLHVYGIETPSEIKFITKKP